MPLRIFDVKIRATIVKTIQVEAEDKKEATELAHQIFSAAPEEGGETERYNEECLSCMEVVECNPPLNCSNEVLVAYIKSMKGGERVMEMGGSGMVGMKGTVEVKDGKVNIRWDHTEYADCAGVMVTSFTAGARIIEPGSIILKIGAGKSGEVHQYPTRK